MKKILIAMILAMSLTSCSKVGINKSPEETILIESSRVTITQADLNNSMGNIEAQLISVYGEGYKEDKEAKKLYNEQLSVMLNQLMTERIMHEKAIDLDLLPDEDTIKSKMEDNFTTLKSLYDMKDASNDELLEKLGYDLKQFREVVINSIINESINTYVKKDLEPVTLDEAKKYYDDNKDYFKINAGMEIAQIKFNVQADADKVYKEIVDGLSFSDALAKYNPDKAETNGYIGFIEYDSPQVDGTFMEVIKGLKEGEISAPVSNTNGSYILKAVKARDESYADFEEIKESLISKLNYQVETDNFNAKIAEWGKELGIEVHTNRIQELK